MLFRLCLLAAVILAGGCARQRASVAVDAALLTQVPGDTVALGAMRVKALRGTAAWKKLLAQKAVNGQLDRLAAETSFDARKDLWEVLWSTDGKETLVYARGEFAPMGLEPRIEREGVQRLNYKGQMLLGNEESAVWFVNSSTGIFGHTAKLRQLIDTRDQRRPGPAEAFRQRIAGIRPDAHFWLVADAAAMPRPKAPEPGEGGDLAMNLTRNLPKLLQSVRMMTMQVSLSDGVAVEWTTACGDEAGARQVHDSLRGIVGLARMGVPAERRGVWLPLLDGVEVTRKEAETTLRARMTVEELENLGATMAGPAKKAE